MTYVKSLLKEELKKYDNYIDEKLEQLHDLVIHHQKLEDQIYQLKETRKELLKALEALDEG